MITHSTPIFSLPPRLLARLVLIIGRAGKITFCFGRKKLIIKGSGKLDEIHWHKSWEHVWE
jgi:hypothetical protein